MTLPPVYPFDPPIMPSLRPPEVGAVAIYGLYDPRDGALRYIGKSTRLRERFWVHVTGHSPHPAIHSFRWLDELRRDKLRPLLVIQEWTDAASWEATEQQAIAHARQQGCRLTNIAPGGKNAGAGAEGRQRISAKSRGHLVTADMRARMSAAQRGVPKDPLVFQRGRAARSESKRGEKNHQARLAHQHIEQIRQLAADGTAQRTIAQRFGVSQATVSRIVRGESWMHVPHGDVPIPSKRGNARLTLEQVQAVRQRFVSGERAAALATQFGITLTHVYRIVRGLCWPESKS